MAKASRKPPRETLTSDGNYIQTLLVCEFIRSSEATIKFSHSQDKAFSPETNLVLHCLGLPSCINLKDEAPALPVPPGEEQLPRQIRGCAPLGELERGRGPGVQRWMSTAVARI